MNPRYKLYMQANSIADHSKVRGYKYIAWIQSMWNVWAEETGRHREWHTKQDHHDFDKWLRKRVSK